MPTISMLPAFLAVFPASFLSVRPIVPENTGLFGIRGSGIIRTEFREKTEKRKAQVQLLLKKLFTGVLGKPG